MGEFDREHSVKLIVDEWGPWYRPGNEATPGNQLEQIPTIRDAVFSGMTLDIFNRNPEKIAMANCAQLINCLNSLYLAHEDKFCVTPVGHVFEMYAAHQGGQSLRTIVSAPTILYDRDAHSASFWGMAGSASLHDKRIVLTVVNPSISEARETRATIHGGAIRSVSATVLAASEMHAHNTFDHPNAVVPATQNAKVENGAVTFTCAAASVNCLVIELA
jgi:alpha-L-arabinofuranosidase